MHEPFSAQIAKKLFCADFFCPFCVQLLHKSNFFYFLQKKSRFFTSGFCTNSTFQILCRKNRVSHSPIPAKIPLSRFFAEKIMNCRRVFLHVFHFFIFVQKTSRNLHKIVCTNRKFPISCRNQHETAGLSAVGTGLSVVAGTGLSVAVRRVRGVVARVRRGAHPAPRAQKKARDRVVSSLLHCNYSASSGFSQLCHTFCTSSSSSNMSSIVDIFLMASSSSSLVYVLGTDCTSATAKV